MMLAMLEGIDKDVFIDPTGKNIYQSTTEKVRKYIPLLLIAYLNP